MEKATAETSHQVITTAHASDTIRAMDCIVAACSNRTRDEMLSQRASKVGTVVYQVLPPQKDKVERILATDIMFSTMSVKSLNRHDG